MTYDEIRAQLAGACEARWPDAMSNDETVISLLPTVRAIAAAAEARGRAEVAAKVEALADVVEQGRAWTGDSLARRLRALAAEATQVHRYDPETQRCTCGALDHPDWGVTA